MPRLDTPVFVGREADLSALLSHAGDVTAGNPRMLLVTGDAGVGKSRLVAEAVTRLVEGGYTAAFGGCVDIPGLEVAQVPFGPFREAARRLGSPAAAAWLRPGGGSAAQTGSSGDAEPAYERLAGFLDLIQAATEQSALVLVLEDLHWADRSSLALLVFLAHNLTTERVLLLATVREQSHRPDGNAAEAALEHLLRLPGVDRIAVRPLPDDAVRELISQLPMQRSRSSLDEVVSRSEGNPLVASELAAHVGSGMMPPNLAASVRERLRRASRPARAALAAVAVVGANVEHGLLLRLLDAPMAGAPAAELDEAVRAAVATGLLRPDGDGYQFRHGLDRDAIYDDLLPGQRQALHQAAALALAENTELDADLAARIAAHWRHAGDREAARRAALQAARLAQAVGAYPEALAQFEHVLERSAGDPGLADLLTEAAEAARFSGDLPRAVRLLERAAATPAPVGRTARIWARLGWFRREAGDDDGSIAAYERALEVIAEDPEPAALARVLAAHARTLMLAGRLGAARGRAEEALDAVRAFAEAAAGRGGSVKGDAGSDPGPPPEPPGDAEASALITLGTVVAMTGEAAAGLALLARARDVAARHGSDEERWRYVTNSVYVLHNLGRNAEAVDVALQELAAVRDQPSLPPLANGAAANAAEGLLHLGRWQEAETLLAATLRRRPPPRFAFQLRMCWAELELLRGRPDAAAGHLEAIARSSTTLRDPEDIAGVHRLQAEAAWQLQDHPAARRHVDEALAQLRDSEEYETEVTLLALGLRVEADAIGLPSALTAQRRAALAGQLETAAGQEKQSRPVAGLETALARAELLRAAGEDEPATWAAVVEEAQTLDRPYTQGYAWLRCGQAALRIRRRAQAQAALENAAGLADKLGAGWLLEAAQSALSHGRLTDRPALAPTESKAASAGLTSRELQVLRLLAQGLTNRLIGRQLKMSEKTASVHVSRILSKLGASNRGEAAAMARALHLLDDAALPPTDY